MNQPTAIRPMSVRGRDRVFQQVGDAHYRLAFPSFGIQFDLERTRRVRDELVGELTVYCEIAGARTVGPDKILSSADWNVSSADARWKRAKLLSERSEASDIDWAGCLEEVAHRVLNAEREGSPARPLTFFEKPGPDAELDVDGWRLLKDHATIAFGDGGSAKSYLALYVLGHLAKRGLNVLYADWELSGGDHRDRLERLFPDPHTPTIHYLRCDRALTYETDRIQREVRRLNIDYWVADSIAFATNGPPEAAEHAMAYFRAVRQIGIGSLHLAHVNRSETSDQKPFGSSFWHNSARATWFIKPSDAEDTSSITIGLFNKKSNLTRRQRTVGFEFRFTDEFTYVERVDIADVDDLASKLPIWDRVRHLLKSGPPLTIAQIATELQVEAEAVKKAVTRKKNSMFAQRPSMDGGPMRIGLVERRA